MKILVLNAGSSSLKFELFDFAAQTQGKTLLRGLAERIGEPEGQIRINDWTLRAPIPDHGFALSALRDYLNRHPEIIRHSDEIRAVGHRVVHGGSVFVAPTLITAQVKAKIRELFELAPLHNPPNLTGIETAEKYFPRSRHIAVFDTAFHRSIPAVEHRYAIPEEYYREGIRQYGFHGISHQYVSRKAMEKLHNPRAKLITLHLGNGASMAAVDAGKSVATTMGFGPLSGLVMGTRSGDIDPSVLLYLLQNGMSADRLSQMLNKQSGLKALFGSNDMRDLEEAYGRGDSRAQLALDMYVRRIQKYIGAYAVVLGRLDALVFTAGIGEHSPLVRRATVQGLGILGARIDERKNTDPGAHDGFIHHPASQVKILVVPTHEEEEIALQCLNLLHG